MSFLWSFVFFLFNELLDISLCILEAVSKASFHSVRDNIYFLTGG